VFFIFNPYLQKLPTDFKNVNFEWCGITRAQNQCLGQKTRDRVMRTLWQKYWKIIIFHLITFPKRILGSTSWKGSSMRTFFVLFIFLYEKHWASYEPIFANFLYIIPIFHVPISQKVLNGFLSNLNLYVEHIQGYEFYHQWPAVALITQWANIAQ